MVPVGQQRQQYFFFFKKMIWQVVIIFVVATAATKRENAKHDKVWQLKALKKTENSNYGNSELENSRSIIQLCFQLPNLIALQSKEQEHIEYSSFDFSNIGLV